MALSTDVHTDSLPRLLQYPVTFRLASTPVDTGVRKKRAATHMLQVIYRDHTSKRDWRTETVGVNEDMATDINAFLAEKGPEASTATLYYRHGHLYVLGAMTVGSM